jgi:hypothetical protein
MGICMQQIRIFAIQKNDEMIRSIRLAVFLMAGLFLASCETDFDINAPGSDITVVFGLLDQNDSIHKIKITKAFLGEDDAILMAQDPVNSDYGDILTVQLEEYLNGALSRTFQCTRTEITDKEEGLFYYPNQYIYVVSADLKTNATYRVVITNNETSKVVEAETGLVGDFSVEKPYYNPSNPVLNLVGNNGLYVEGEAKWKSAVNGRLYEPVFRFNYREVDQTTSDTTDKHIDWRLTSVKSQSLVGGEIMINLYNSEAFYRYLEANIPVDYNKTRLIGKVDFIISVGGDELTTYIDLNGPSSSIIQERPAYTNISNGIGIFSCRRTIQKSFNLSFYSVDKLINGEFTNQLNFQ